eukprot:4748893-Heterocapsa_arctica.AAC.1
MSPDTSFGCANYTQVPPLGGFTTRSTARCLENCCNHLQAEEPGVHFTTCSLRRPSNWDRSEVILAVGLDGHVRGG